MELEQIVITSLPIEVAISAVTMAELSAGPHAASDAEERARRQDRLQRAEAAFDPLGFEGEAARSHGRSMRSSSPKGAKHGALALSSY
jgi:hypothetical protein